MEQRRQPRIPFSCSARLLTEGEGTGLAAQVQNISATGLFLTTEVAPKPGSQVRCRFRLGRSPRELKGRVAWVQRLRGERAGLQGSGAGIEFVGLGDDDRQLLEELAQNADPHNQAPLEPLTVWFEGLSAPVKTQGRIGPEEIVVTTELPFLRVGSDVKVGLAGNGQFRYARIEGLALDFLRPQEPPRIVVRLRAAESMPEAGELATALRTRGEAFAGSNPTPAPELEEAVKAEAYDSYELNSPPPGALTPPPHLLATAPPALHAAAASQERALPPPTPSPLVRSLAFAPGEAGTPSPPLLPAPTPPRWIWAIVAAIVLLAVAWLLMPTNAPPEDEVQIAVESMLPPTPSARVMQAARTRPDVTPLPATPPAAEASPAPEAPPDIPPPPRFARAPFTLQREPNATVVVVPVLGPSAPSEVLALSPQPGVVAILSRARLPHNQGLFVVKHPVIDRVAVETRPLGVYVRVLFGPRAGGYKLEHGVGELRVIVAHQ